MLKVFVITPVRWVDEKFEEYISGVVEKLDYDPLIKVHYPPRDTNQVDETGGYHICMDNFKAIEKSDVILFFWDGKSHGCLFDAGMAFASRKPIFALSLPELDLEKSKSFSHMFTYWGMQSNDDVSVEFLKEHLYMLGILT